MAKTKAACKVFRLTRLEREALRIANQCLYQKGGCITGGGWDAYCRAIDRLLKRTRAS